MLRFNSATRSASRGFSLIELVIVVGVTGLLFGGLWRLMSSGNTQLREQTTADQMTQLVNATRNFLASNEGQTFLTGINGMSAATRTQQLFLPDVAASAAGQANCIADLNTRQANVGAYCNFLPTGFHTTGAGATTNAFGQSYEVYVRKDATAAGTPAQNYEFLIITTGGDTIPDSSGGRIAANIGANGGFIFSNDTCGTPVDTMACGSFGSFQISLAAGGPFGAIASSGRGHIVTQNTSTLSAGVNSQWLARILVPGDGGATPIFNTMTVPLHMRTGSAPLNMRGNNIHLGNNGTVTTGGGEIELQGGSITGPGQIDISSVPAGTDPVLIVDGTAIAGSARVAEIIGSGCDTFVTTACDPALHVTGSVNIVGSVDAANGSIMGTLRAATFIYGSDQRYKDNIAPLESALEKISRLKGYHFTWKEDGRADIGLIAQEVQKTFPELVHTGKDGRLGVEYGNLVAPLIEAVKELRQQNAELRQRLEAQEKKIEALRRR